MNRLRRAAGASASSLAWLGLLALTACAGGAAAPVPPPPPPPPPTSPGATFWLAPNGSEVVLKLSLIQPTVPF